MNRVEFMAQLERLLFDLPENERQDALCYYNDYFDDAGEENEGKVIQELGSPGKVAAIIRAGYRGGSSGENRGEYTENGYRDTMFSNENQMPAAREENTREQTNERRSWWEEQRDRRNEWRTSGNERAEKQEEYVEGLDHEEKMSREKDWMSQGHQRRGVGGWILLVIAAVFLLPVILGVGGGLVGVTGGLIGAIIALIGSGITLVVSGIMGIVKGAFLAVTSPGAGLVAIGGSLLLMALGILLIIFFAWLLFKVCPRIFRGVVNFLSRVFHHGQGKDEGGTME